MSANVTVRASVVDITTDTPLPTDLFLVDTNVWFWQTYTKASISGASHYQTRDYPDYLQRALAVQASLSYCTLNLCELAGVIEGAERTIHKKKGVACTAKEFRHNFATERRDVTLEISEAFIQVDAIASSIQVSIGNEATQKGLMQLMAVPIDIEDAIALAAASGDGVTQVITDDGDFGGVPNLTVFTANQNVLAAAKAQGRLLVR